MDKTVTVLARPTSPSPTIMLEETRPRPVLRPVRPARPALQSRRPLNGTRGPLTLGALCYALLAAALAAAVIGSGASWHLVVPAAGLCALAACVAEWLSSRRASLPARDLALAVYIAGALLLPAPWAVLVVVAATLVSLPARRGLSAAVLLATTAHTVLAVTMFTVAAHVALGDGRVWRDVAAFAGNPAALSHALSIGTAMPALARGDQPWYGAAFHAPWTLAILLFLCGAYYLLETVPPALLCAVARRRRPLRAWSDLYGHAVPLQLVALPLAPTLVALYTVAPALAPLALPLPFGAVWIAAALHRARAVEDEARVLRENTAALYARAAEAEERVSRGDASAAALLAAIRAIGGNDDLVEVTSTLAEAATRLTPFRACIVYLYESRDGVFVARAGQLEGARRGAVVSRARVEALMSPRHLLGYSYYVPRPGHDGTEAEQGFGGGTALGPWQDGDVLLTPLLLKNGDVIGYIGLDRPFDRRVPSAAELAPLETLAFLAASVIARLRHTDEALRLAASDGLTGLLNRRAFEEHLHRELAAAARRERPLALMMIDIDDFGNVNNTHGHQVGDAALRLVAGVIREHLRESDAGARYGGDEFTIVLPELDAVRAADIAERLRAALAAATERATADGSLPQLFTSIGVAAYPRHAGNASALVKAADDALYDSKRMGKNCVSVR